LTRVNDPRLFEYIDYSRFNFARIALSKYRRRVAPTGLRFLNAFFYLSIFAIDSSKDMDLFSAQCKACAIQGSEIDKNKPSPIA
jgi:hypothetical protein